MKGINFRIIVLNNAPNQFFPRQTSNLTRPGTQAGHPQFLKHRQPVLGSCSSLEQAIAIAIGLASGSRHQQEISIRMTG
jgi:hypothetical protein